MCSDHGTLLYNCTVHIYGSYLDKDIDSSQVPTWLFNYHKHPSVSLLSSMSWDCMQQDWWICISHAWLPYLLQRTWLMVDIIVVPLTKSVLGIDPNVIEIVNKVIGSVIFWNFML